ncbi:putative zinc finger/helix-turn-helix protein [[Clostridium] sordellii]|uniref:Panacea domain-containing protein n=1 Tax=Paraclostridium sordellii TaxID=1505 RepID=UPI0005E8B10D|nr:type II toxin-antitoxin system antitoxin SocA domain-containing protein [Paeniclostridium sordellii]CEO36540.1 putative zinc finger/helix-turn-helix protein [[Clostridium] sordellii] [Paeniclostridium sordellii]
MISIFDLANTFLAFDIMTHKKLQKLCYYAYSWYLVKYKTPLINNKFEAWRHGPVCDDLYQRYKDYGNRPICSSNDIPINVKKNKEVLDFINKIYEIYGKYDADKLEKLTHSEDPWKLTRIGLSDNASCRRVITDQSIINYYSNL